MTEVAQLTVEHAVTATTAATAKDAQTASVAEAVKVYSFWSSKNWKAGVTLAGIVIVLSNILPALADGVPSTFAGWCHLISNVVVGSLLMAARTIATVKG